jgi:signal transduction histidine kinase
MAISNACTLEPSAPLAETEHLKTKFLRRIAHDIASPAGVTMTVLDELAVAGSARPELLAMAHRSLRRLMRISENLALVAELESGPIEPELAADDLRELARHAVDDALAIDGRKDILLVWSAPDHAVPVACDVRLLTVVIREIAGNAIKLASSRVAVTVSSVDGEGVVRVEDDGPGFSDEARALVGRRFAPNSSSRGLGLSLSMGSEIVAAHGGHLALDASTLPARREAVGAAVVLSLPLSHLPH